MIWRFLTAVFLFPHSHLFLILPHGYAGNGTVLLAVPLHRTDVVSDDEDSRNIKLLVRSPTPIASMASLSSDPTTSRHDPLKMASILPPRSPGVLYQMTIGFETKEVCEGVIKFIEARR